MAVPRYVRLGSNDSDDSTASLRASRGGALLRLYGGWVLAGVICLLWVRLDIDLHEEPR